jgi:hypothetical protein
MLHQYALLKKAIRFGTSGLLGLSLAFMACNSDKGTGPDKATPSLKITSPAKGSSAAGNGFMVKVLTTDFSYGKIGDPNKDGSGHIHVYLDKPASSGAAYTTVITGGDTATLTGPISAGEHYLIVSMQKNDHSPYNIQDSVAFTVTAAASPTPSVTISQPAEGATVSGPVVFKLSPKNFKVSAPGTNKAGEGHFHYFVDGGAYQLLTDTTFTLEGLNPGPHKVKIALQNNAHADLGIDITVNFTVAASATAPSFAIVSPVEGATLGSSVTVALSTANFKVSAPSGTLATGEGHLHYFVDGGTYNALADTLFTLNDLAVGEHTVRVTMQDNKHADLNIERTVKFTVSASAQSFKISSPKNGDTLTGPVTLTMIGKNFAVAAPGAVKANEGHYHYFIDNGTYNALADTTINLSALTAGPHTLKVTMQNGDHSDYGLVQWVSFIVK